MSYKSYYDIPRSIFWKCHNYFLKKSSCFTVLIRAVKCYCVVYTHSCPHIVRIGFNNEFECLIWRLNQNLSGQQTGHQTVWLHECPAFILLPWHGYITDTFHMDARKKLFISMHDCNLIWQSLWILLVFCTLWKCQRSGSAAEQLEEIQWLAGGHFNKASVRWIRSLNMSSPVEGRFPSRPAVLLSHPHTCI